eukprot:NODE_906_length_1317_cov_3.366878.p5 GENE.NODE_906_length_1317_cov_3.366878~~NODE_906_length_1317_cov_3.366878.p5  ORF type:complete len:58 (-),score=0.92 NODE_906_length_1317_cov_3.366878:817-990(-)
MWIHWKEKTKMTWMNMVVMLIKMNQSFQIYGKIVRKKEVKENGKMMLQCMEPYKSMS